MEQVQAQESALAGTLAPPVSWLEAEADGTRRGPKASLPPRLPGRCGLGQGPALAVPGSPLAQRPLAEGKSRAAPDTQSDVGGLGGKESCECGVPASRGTRPGPFPKHAPLFQDKQEPQAQGCAQASQEPLT